ncbi:unnamed protein product, partial [Dovyalis caffra]
TCREGTRTYNQMAVEEGIIKAERIHGKTILAPLISSSIIRECQMEKHHLTTHPTGHSVFRGRS